MQVRSTIAEVARIRHANFGLPRVPKTVSVATAIGLAAISIETKPPPNIDEIAARLRLDYRAGRTPARRDINKAPWCIWDGREPLANSTDVLRAFLDAAQRIGSRRLFRRLASAYLVRFPTSKPGLAEVSQTLQALASRFEGPWSAAAKDVSLFDAEHGPKRVAEVALSGGRSVWGEIASRGIENLPADARFTEAAFQRGLETIRAEPSADPAAHLARIATWGSAADGTIVFSQHRGALVDALVLPFAQSMPAKATRDAFIAFLVANFGDPRLHPGHWLPMPASAQIIRRWLTDQSLRQFLDVFDDSALEHQWKYRRAFWEAVYKQNLILDAWVIFDKVGAQRAKRLFEAEAPFARWDSKGSKQIQSGQGCLLLRIGRGVVAEWSHNGRCHIWFDVRDPTAPAMHQETYNSDEVMLGRGGRGVEFRREMIQHQNSKGYLWQSRISDALHSMTGVRIQQREYRVR
jgi:EH_Signature domain